MFYPRGQTAAPKCTFTLLRGVIDFVRAAVRQPVGFSKQCFSGWDRLTGAKALLRIAVTVLRPTFYATVSKRATNIACAGAGGIAPRRFYVRLFRCFVLIGEMFLVFIAPAVHVRLFASDHTAAEMNFSGELSPRPPLSAFPATRKLAGIGLIDNTRFAISVPDNEFRSRSSRTAADLLVKSFH